MRYLTRNPSLRLLTTPIRRRHIPSSSTTATATATSSAVVRSSRDSTSTRPFSSTQTLRMASSGPTMSSVGIHNSNVTAAPGVSLTEHQKLVVGSVLDLFEGRPSLKHLALWNPKGTFQDPIALAEGYDRFAAQWYGLPALFDPINLQSHKVIEAGNPIVFQMSNKYTVKGIKQEKVMDSIIRVTLGQDGKIDKVEDRWNDKLPDGSVSEAFRKLNAMTVPNLVKVPKTEEEDQKMQAERHGAKQQ